MGDLDKLIVAKGFKKLPKVQLIAQSGHTASVNSITKHLIHNVWSYVLAKMVYIVGT